MFGEMAVFLREEFSENLEYSQKQSLQHMDKSKFLGVQFEYLFSSGLWKRTAQHANALAKRLEKKLAERGITPYYPVQTNMVFCRLDEEQLKKVNEKFDVAYWDGTLQTVRFAMTHETTPEMIAALAALL